MTGDVDGADANAKAVLSFGDAGGELLVQVAISAVDRRRRPREPGRRVGRLRLRRHPRAGPRRPGPRRWIASQIEGADRRRADDLRHRPVPQLPGAQPVQRRGRPLPRAWTRQIHTAEGRDQYTVFSLWDTYRATHPLFTLVERERTSDFVQTFLAQYEQGGRLPVWELAGNETDCMIGYHSRLGHRRRLAQGHRRLRRRAGPGGHGPQRRAATTSAWTPTSATASSRADQEAESVSKTLEYAYDDACIARLAEALGRDDIAAEFDRRAQAWRHLLRPADRLLPPAAQRPVAHALRPPPGGLPPHRGQRLAVPLRRAPAHARASSPPLGGDDAFAAALDSLFTIDSATTGRDQADITGRIGQYAHGNEPSHHVAWLYHFTGQPEQSAARVAADPRRFYTAAPGRPDRQRGLRPDVQLVRAGGLGLYDVAPTSRQWLIDPAAARAHERALRGRPRLHHPARGQRRTSARDLQRRAAGRAASCGTRRSSAAASWSSSWARPATGARRRQTGRAPADGATPIVPAPWAEAGSDRFRGSLDVRLVSAEPGAVIRWTDRPDGDPREGQSTPSPSAWTPPPLCASSPRRRPDQPRGDRPLRRHRPRLASRRGLGAQRPVHRRRPRRPDRRPARPRRLAHRRLAGLPGPGLRGHWTWASRRRSASAGAGFLQDMRSWIWMPPNWWSRSQTTVRPSSRPAASGHDVPDDQEGVFRRDLDRRRWTATPIRALRFRAVNYGTIPAWHPGAGGEAFIFVDELLVTGTQPR